MRESGGFCWKVSGRTWVRARWKAGLGQVSWTLKQNFREEKQTLVLQEWSVWWEVGDLKSHRKGKGLN